MSEKPPVSPFVVGCGRSGTTLVRVILDSHSDLSVVHESGFVSSVVRRRSLYERTSGFALDRFCSDLIGHYQFRNLEMTASELRHGLQAASPGTLPEAVRGVFRLYAERRGKSR